MHQLARIAGALTLGYGAAILASPKLMAKPCELTEPDGTVPPATATMIRALGLRDVVSGVSLLVAPIGKPLAVAGAVRSGSDLGDAVLLGLLLPSKRARLKAASVASGWAAICAAAVAVANSR